MRDHDPSSITPRIKILLHKRNKLRRAGKMEEADHVAVKVNRQVARDRSTALAGTSDADTKRLCGLSRRTGNWNVNQQTISNIELNYIKDYFGVFTNIATNPEYDRSAVIKAAPRAPHRAVVIIFPVLNAGCKVPETRSLIGYCLHVYNVQFIFIFKFYMYICK